MAKLRLKKGQKAFVYPTIEGEVKITPGKDISIPFLNAIPLVGANHVDVIFEASDKQHMQKLKRSRFVRLERAHKIPEHSKRDKLINKMFPKSRARKILPVKKPVKPKAVKRKPKVDKDKPTTKI